MSEPENTSTKDEVVEEKITEDPVVEEQDNDALAALKAESEKNFQGWQRALADFKNYKRRVERDQQDSQTKIAIDILIKILPIIDDFERAMASVPEEHSDTPWINGVNLINGKFKKLLDEYDVVAFDPIGELFDPNIHQAISMDDSDEYESGHVIETLQKGYQSGDVLLRPALVRVAN